MRYLSTRGRQETDLLGTILQGLATDGGLFVPDEMPHFEPTEIRGETLAEIAGDLLAPFFVGSPLAAVLAEICRDALDFPVPLVTLRDEPDPLAVLELFHGPTAAFKDVGARFLAAAMERALPLARGDTRPLTILVATSGDTGGAVAAAFHRRRGMRVAVLYPRGQVSPRQQHQLNCWDDNVRSYEVEGTFDDCQALLKGALADPALSRRQRLSAANSINIGRLLPQVAYHAAAGLWYWREHATPISAIVPTGNLGNGLACIWARAMGMPIRDVVFAVNANRTVPEFLATGEWQPRGSVRTLASAMDVGAPGNMERLRHLFPEFAELRAAVEAYPVDDAAIRAQIVKDDARFGRVWCPHTATGFWVYDHLPENRRAGRPWYVCATAHPAKFDTIVEGIVGRHVPVPPSLAALLARPAQSRSLAPRIEALADALAQWDKEL
ncbi:MAG TPA: threonine synthase [Gammaproteobacteria bacterium]